MDVLLALKQYVAVQQILYSLVALDHVKCDLGKSVDIAGLRLA
jgi:hypothetical protein